MVLLKKRRLKYENYYEEAKNQSPYFVCATVELVLLHIAI